MAEGSEGASRARTDPRVLAVEGGDPMFADPVHVGRPNIGDRAALHARIDELLDRRWLTNNGPLVQEFEVRIAELTDTRHCIAVANATLGLQVLAQASELTGEVIVPSFTFVATAHAFRTLGLEPVFCDVDPDTHTLDPERVLELITARTSAIVGVHLWGRSCEVERLAAIAADHGLRLYFDAAHAFGCSHGSDPVGSFGDAEVFSFHATKFVNAFEGGAITTNDDELAARLRLARNFGFVTFDRVASLGTNAKMSEASAAMGLTSLESMDGIIATNQANLEAYEHHLAPVPGVRLLRPPDGSRSNYQYVVLEIDETEFGISRDVLLDVLHAENVLARRYFYPGCHRMEPYHSEDPTAFRRLRVTDELSRTVLVLPTGTAVSVDDIAAVCGIVVTAHERAESLASTRQPVTSTDVHTWT